MGSTDAESLVVQNGTNVSCVLAMFHTHLPSGRGILPKIFAVRENADVLSPSRLRGSLISRMAGMCKRIFFECLFFNPHLALNNVFECDGIDAIGPKRFQEFSEFAIAVDAHHFSLCQHLVQWRLVLTVQVMEFHKRREGGLTVVTNSN